MELAEQIAALRKKHGFSQEELGEKLGVSRQAVSKWESSQAVPELEKLKELCRIFGVSLNELLQLEENGQVREEENLLSQQAEKNIAEQPRSTADKRKKQDHKLFVFTIAGFALVLAVTVFCLQVQIQDLNRQMSDLQSGLSSVRSEWSMAISSLRASIEQSLESQTSIVSEYHYDIISLQPVTKQARVKFTVTPKNCTADTTAVLSFTGADFEPITLEASKSGGGTFEGTVD